MISNTKKIKLFASCIPVKGAKRSVICDTQRKQYNFIPNDLCNLLNLHEGKNIEEIKKAYDNQFDDSIEEYITFLLEEEFAFLTDMPELYPKMDLDWHEPFLVNNAIIDFDESFEIEKILSQLDELKCKSIEFRFYNPIKLKTIHNILSWLEDNNSIICSLGFIIPHSKETEQVFLEEIISNNPRLSYFIITSAPENNSIEKLINRTVYIAYTKEKINSSSHCGIMTNKNFVVNTKMFTESQNHNTCLNRKISIDKEGNIRNCPSMRESFGNIKDTTLEEALNHPNFKKYWNITKDQIDVCKDCEFRHICTDCRAYTENPDDQYSKPLKCGYSPYTNVWEEWSTNPLKQKGIEYYGMQELIKKEA